MVCSVEPNAIICSQKYSCVDLRPFGANVWMYYHEYLGPAFYRSESMIKQMEPGEKTIKAFNKWFDQSGIECKA